MNTSDAFIGKNANAHLPKYIASRPKKICRSSKTKLSTIQKNIIQAYIQSTSNFDQNFYIWPFFQQTSLLNILLNCIVKIIKPL